MPAAIDIAGQKFGKLTALRRTDKQTPAKQYIWECVCECGNTTETRIGNLRCGRTKSCGCLQLRKGSEAPAYKHGRSQTKEYDIELHMKRNYGVDISGYNKMLENQNGVCAICKSSAPNHHKKRLNIDHCHVTGRVRGLLCDACNRALGLFKDSPDLMLKAITYVSK